LPCGDLLSAWAAKERPLEVGAGVSVDLAHLRALLRAGRFEWSKHALQRLAKRSISQEDVLQVLGSGERIEDYPQDKPYPSALFLGWVGERPIHVVAAVDAEHEWAYIITTYEPGGEHFGPDHRTRK
jgi:hypothetical protein